MLRGLGSVAIAREDLERAEDLLGEALTLAPDAGTVWEAAGAANLLGTVAFTRGDYLEAIRRSEEALTVWRQLGDTGHASFALSSLAHATLAAGDHARAAATVREVLTQLTDGGDDTLRGDCFEAAAGLALAAADPLQAARLLAASDAVESRLGTPRRPAFQAMFELRLAAAQRSLTERAFAAALTEGRAASSAESTTNTLAVLDVIERPARARRHELTGPTALTRREREVLRLLVDGLSDKEIAAALGIVRYTASNHVTAIRDKLGAPSRAAVVAIAVREGLV